MNGDSPDEVRRCLLTELLPGPPSPDDIDLLLKLAGSDTSARLRAAAVQRLALVPDPEGRCRARLVDLIEQDEEPPCGLPR